MKVSMNKYNLKANCLNVCAAGCFVMLVNLVTALRWRYVMPLSTSAFHN